MSRRGSRVLAGAFLAVMLCVSAGAGVYEDMIHAVGMSDERTVASLDDKKRQTNGELMAATDPAEALRLHNEVVALSAELAAAEERWCQLQEEIAEAK